MKPWSNVPLEEVNQYTARIIFKRNNPQIPIEFPTSPKPIAAKLKSYLHLGDHHKAMELIKACNDPDEASEIFEIVMKLNPGWWVAFARNSILMEGIGSLELQFLLDKADTDLQSPKKHLWRPKLMQIGEIIFSNALLCRRIGYTNLIPYTRNNPLLLHLIIRNRIFLSHLDYATIRNLCRTTIQTEKIIGAILLNIEEMKTKYILYWAASALEHIATGSYMGEYLIKRKKSELRAFLGDFLESRLKQIRKSSLIYPYPKLHSIVMEMRLEEKMASLSLDSDQIKTQRSRSCSVPAPSSPSWMDQEKENQSDHSRHSVYICALGAGEEHEAIEPAPTYAPVHAYHLEKTSKLNDVRLEGFQPQDQNEPVRSKKNIFKRMISWCS